MALQESPSHCQSKDTPVCQKEIQPQVQPAEKPSKITHSVEASCSTSETKACSGWADYYRSVGMIREAELIEEEENEKLARKTQQELLQEQAEMQQREQLQKLSDNQIENEEEVNDGRPVRRGRTSQWVDYYQTIGKHKEAAIIENEMNAKTEYEYLLEVSKMLAEQEAVERGE